MSRATPTFGDVLRQLRTAASLSQEDLAERAGVSLRGVSDLERGVRRAPHLTTVRLLADALVLTPTDRQILFSAARPGPRPKDARLGAARLPKPLTSLIGREPELADLTGLLTQAATRLVTVTGPGGSGKTRLALEVAWRLQSAFADGVVFIDLTPLRDAELVLATIATTLGVHEQSGQPLLETLTRVVAPKQMLLLVDNCEQVLGAAPEITTLLAGCPQLTVLATSREPLRVRSERAFPLLPLPLPASDSRSSVEEVARAPAVALFVERAQAAGTGFALTAENVAAVAAVCRRLDGLPLAIELAAARVLLFPPETLLVRLERRLPMLTGGARDLPARQRTMRDTIAWSYDQLSREEQVLFRRLAVFAGGFTLDGAEAVGNHDGGLNAFSGIASLIDKSLLRQEEGVGGEPRFRMLETIREYGLERLDASGEGDAVRQRHAAYFAALGIAGETQSELWLAMAGTLDRFERDIDNLRAAMAWAEQAGDARTGLIIANAFESPVFHRGQPAEGRAWLTRLLALDADVPIAVRALAVCNIGWIALFQGDLDAAEAAAEQAVNLAATEPLVLGSSLDLLACTLWGRGLLAEARQRFEEALAAVNGHPKANAVLPMTLVNFGVFAQLAGNRPEARDRFEAGLAALPVSDVSFLHPLLLGNLAQLAWEEGDIPRSANLIIEALRLGRIVRSGFVLEGTLHLAARHVLAAGRAHTAARLIGAVDGLSRRTGIAAEQEVIAEREALVAQVQQILGEAAWTQARADGESLPLDQAISEATDVMTEVTCQSTNVGDLPSQ